MKQLKENKQEILDSLAYTINLCRIADDQVSFEYDEQQEIVAIVQNERLVTTVNVACDSGIAMIRDVINNKMFY